MLKEFKVFPMKIKANQTKLHAACNVRHAAACMRNPSIKFDLQIGPGNRPGLSTVLTKQLN